MPDLKLALVYYVVFLLSTTLHEAAHAWAALKGGDPTAYHGGQVSLDPIPHVRREPVGMVLLPLASVFLIGWPFGFASAPYDPQWALRHPRRSAWMALAGPAGNLVLVIGAGVLMTAGRWAGVFYSPPSVNFGTLVGASSPVWQAVGLFLGVVFSLNVLLAIFNLIPVPPLDGSGAMPLLMSDDTARRYLTFLWSNPFLGWIGIFVAWQAFDVVFWPVFRFSVEVLYPGVYQW